MVVQAVRRENARAGSLPADTATLSVVQSRPHASFDTDQVASVDVLGLCSCTGGGSGNFGAFLDMTFTSMGGADNGSLVFGLMLRLTRTQSTPTKKMVTDATIIAAMFM